jgi:hypothetical protein
VIGWNAIVAEGEMVIATIAHEAAHLYQMDHGMTRDAYAKNPAKYEGEATRMQEEYLKRLGYGPDVINGTRRYSTDLQ